MDIPPRCIPHSVCFVSTRWMNKGTNPLPHRLSLQQPCKWQRCQLILGRMKEKEGEVDDDTGSGPPFWHLRLQILSRY